MEIEGAAAGYYVAALFESARPGHRGLNTDRLVRDALSRSRAALGCLRNAHFAVRVYARARPVFAPFVEMGTGSPRPRGSRRARHKPRPSGAA